MGTKHYDKIFKENAVNLSYKRSSLSTLSRELGVSVSQLSKWRKEYLEFGTASFQGKGVERLTDEQYRIKQLEKALNNSELELEISKIAIAVFSKIDK